jgi:POT family proton-dependent oligopeptide transporter
MTSTRRSQPAALPYLSLTELWERFGFYIVQGLLVLYLTQSFGMSDQESYEISGLYAGVVYIAPFFGGMIADRWLGFQTSILLGGLFLVLGYSLLALPIAPQYLLYPALSTIIIGNGLFKPNISSLLGNQYDIGDVRRDSGFTIFYIGINIGVFLAGMSSGYIRELFGWHASFGMAAVGLLIGLAVFIRGFRHLRHNEVEYSITRIGTTILGAILLITIVSLLFHVPAVANYILPGAGVLLLFYLTSLTKREEGQARRRLMLLNFLIISSVIFWAIFTQIFFAANLFIDRLVDHNFFGYHLATTVFYSSESIFIILLGPFFAWSWHALGRNDLNPSPVLKFASGLLFLGLGFLVLAISTRYLDANGQVHALWVFAGYFIITIGELLVSPVGLSAVTMLAPRHLVGMMMGVWFVATGFGGLFAGQLAKTASIPETVVTTAGKMAIYHGAFLYFAILAIGVSALLFVLHLFLKKMK